MPAPGHSRQVKTDLITAFFVYEVKVSGSYLGYWGGSVWGIRWK